MPPPIFSFAALLTLADMLPLIGESIVQTYRHKKNCAGRAASAVICDFCELLCHRYYPKKPG